MSAATLAAVAFYDVVRNHGSHERFARAQAVCYLRRKRPELDELEACEILADALALRAAARINIEESGE